MHMKILLVFSANARVSSPAGWRKGESAFLFTRYSCETKANSKWWIFSVQFMGRSLGSDTWESLWETTVQGMHSLFLTEGLLWNKSQLSWLWKAGSRGENFMTLNLRWNGRKPSEPQQLSDWTLTLFTSSNMFHVTDHIEPLHERLLYVRAEKLCAAVVPH